MTHPRVLACLVLASAVMAGCATNRSEVSLGAPSTPSAANVAAGGQPIVIRSVRDARSFEAAPRDPSIPSLGLEGSDKASADVKARAVGRKRNTYGMALGDVLLEPGHTVESEIRSALSVALSDAGYEVVSLPAPAGAPGLDVRIDDFWSWINPGFFAITVSCKITTQLDFGNGRGPVAVGVRSEESTLAATDGTWADALRKCVERYRAEILARKSELP